MKDAPGLRLYRSLTGLAQALAPALLQARVRAGKEDPARVGERLGHTERERPPGPLVWLHGASVGESLSLLPLIKAIGGRRSDVTVLTTSGTVTAAEMMARRLPPEALHQFNPVDTPAAVSRFLDHWRPDLAVFVESELWPNLIGEAKRRNVRLALLSARLSEQSLKGWAKAPRSAAALLGAFDLVMAQDEAAAGRLAALGARDDGRLNLKLAGEPLPVALNPLEAARRAAKERPVLLAASTHPGEDEVVLDAFKALKDRRDRPLLVIAPRHPARGPDIVALATSQGFKASAQSAGGLFGMGEVYVADALGELGLWFRLARAAFVGGSLVEGPGGHNPVEPARLGVPIVSGPLVDNWRSVFDLFLKDDAVVIAADAQGLATAFAGLLNDETAAQAMAARALAIPDGEAQALDDAVALLVDLLPELEREA